MIKCANCDTESDGKYCPECGQKMQFARLSIKTIFYDKIHDVTHWENTVLYTLRHLITSPGETVRNYITGKKKSIVKPVKFYLSVSAVHVVIFHWLNKNLFDYQHRADELNAVNEAAMAQNVLNTYLNYFDFFLPVFFSFFLYLFYRKKTGVNYAESIAVSFYWIGTTMMFTVAVMLLSLIDIRIWYSGIVINVIYLIYASIQFSGSGKAADYARSVLFVGLSYISFLTIAAGVINLYLKYIK